jgi:hypothetical protein
MRDELIRAALRVRFCFTLSRPTQPDPADMEQLRQHVNGEEKDLRPNVLAARVLRREMERRRSDERRGKRAHRSPHAAKEDNR